jgi:hypothetical protein
MLTHADMNDQVRRGLSILQDYIRTGTQLNLTDASVTAEVFVQGLLNRAYGWKLRDLNAAQRNHPCLDLLDDVARLGVQVSASNTSEKANDALSCLRRRATPLPITVLKLFTLVAKQRKYTVRVRCPGVRFVPKDDVLDFATVIKELDRSTMNRVKAVHDYVVATIPQAFAFEAALKREQAAALATLLALFDRAVLYDPASAEDPVAMLRSLRELRVDLQQRGALRIGPPEAATAFRNAVMVLRECERDVESRFPNVAWAAERGERPVGGYSPPIMAEYSEAIQRMMEVRVPLAPILADLETTLTAVCGSSVVSTTTSWAQPCFSTCSLECSCSERSSSRSS